MHSFSLSYWSMASQSFGPIPCSRIVIQVSFTTEMWCVRDKAGMFHSIYELINSDYCNFLQHIFFLCTQVPQHFSVMKYQPFCTHYAATSYKPRKLSRPLRQGAQVGNKSSQIQTLKSLPTLNFWNYLINFVSILYTRRLTTLWKPLMSVFFKDELIQIVASPEGQPNLVSHSMDFHKPSAKEVAERDISLLNLVPPQALVNPTESNPLRIFVSRSWFPQGT